MLCPRRRAPFDRFAGTSVGAINATYLASQAHRADLGVERLLQLWGGLRLRTHLRPSRTAWRQRALLDVAPFEDLIRAQVDWGALNHNLDQGLVAALFLAALHVDTGRTTVFSALAPDTHYAPTAHPHRVALRTRITADHVLASAAIPTVFPPRRVGEALYYDGGLRFNTPMAPTIRAGARRLVVVSPLHAGTASAPAPHAADHLPDAWFLGGKMLHAVLLDPFAYDLEVLQRFNDLLASLDQSLDPDARAAFDRRVTELRGAPYRALDVLALSPSRDLGAMALDFLATHRRVLAREGPLGLGLAAVARRLADSGTDLVSYVLFDGRYTRQLVELGRRDVWDRADEVRAFFRDGPAGLG